jgi:predicted RNA polymerase sigma factor
VVELNRAVAVAMGGGLERGLALVKELDHRGEGIRNSNAASPATRAARMRFSRPTQPDTR